MPRTHRKRLEELPIDAKESLNFKGLFLTPDGHAYGEDAVGYYECEPYINRYTQCPTGYHMIHYSGRIIRLHKEIALCFVKGFKSNALVQHIDGNTLNDNANNLKWVSRGEVSESFWTDELKEKMRERMLKQHSSGKMKEHLKKLHETQGQRMKERWARFKEFDEKKEGKE